MSTATHIHACIRVCVRLYITALSIKFIWQTYYFQFYYARHFILFKRFKTPYQQTLCRAGGYTGVIQRRATKERRKSAECHLHRERDKIRVFREVL